MAAQEEPNGPALAGFLLALAGVLPVYGALLGASGIGLCAFGMRQHRGHRLAVAGLTIGIALLFAQLFYLALFACCFGCRR